MTLTQYPPLIDIYIRRANRNDNLIHSLGIIVVRSEFYNIIANNNNLLLSRTNCMQVNNMLVKLMSLFSLNKMLIKG